MDYFSQIFAGAALELVPEPEPELHVADVGAVADGVLREPQ